jgi:hypothetical protein
MSDFAGQGLTWGSMAKDSRASCYRSVRTVQSELAK